MSFEFPSATDSRNISDLRAIHSEICALQTAILDAREQGLRMVTVCDSPMALSTEHFDAWFINVDQNQCAIVIADPDEAHLIDLQDQVIKCFTGLGYSIVRMTNPNTGNTFCWEISW